MQLKKELIEWYNLQLEDKNIFISSTDQLATGYHFLQILHNFHSKTVDLSKLYLKPKNEYEILQNYKLLASCFAKLGWKKLDPERYSKKKQKDYLSLAQTLRKILSSRNIKDSQLQSNLDVTLDEFKSEQKVEERKLEHPGQLCNSAKIVQLEKTKQELLTTLSRIHEELYREGPGDDGARISALRQRINEIINNNLPT